MSDRKSVMSPTSNIENDTSRGPYQSAPLSPSQPSRFIWNGRRSTSSPQCAVARWNTYGTCFPLASTITNVSQPSLRTVTPSTPPSSTNRTCFSPSSPSQRGFGWLQYSHSSITTLPSGPWTGLPMESPLVSWDTVSQVLTTPNSTRFR